MFNVPTHNVAVTCTGSATVFQSNNNTHVTREYKAGEACRAIYNEHEHSGVWLSSKHNKKVVSTP